MTAQSDCLFCKMASGEMAIDKLHDDEQVFALRDINPRAPVHILIVPKRHIDSVRELGPDDGPLLGHMVDAGNRLAEREGLAERGFRLTFNVGAEGGQTISHVHMHLLGGRQLGAEG